MTDVLKCEQCGRTLGAGEYRMAVGTRAPREEGEEGGTNESPDAGYKWLCRKCVAAWAAEDDDGDE